jgi:hypothetical protein
MSNVVSINKGSRLETFEGVLKSYREKVKRINATENVLVLDLNESNIFHIKLRKNLINITFDNLPESEHSYSCTIILKQDSQGYRKVVFPENVYWSFGEVAVLSTKPEYADVITLMTFDGGESYYATHALANLGK